MAQRKGKDTGAGYEWPGVEEGDRTLGGAIPEELFDKLNADVEADTPADTTS